MIGRFAVALIAITSANLACTTNEDRSRTVEEYIASGMPPLDDNWINMDIRECLDVLKELKEKDFYCLPRKGSEKSGRVFDKLTSPDNQLFYVDSAETSGILTDLVTIYLDSGYSGRPSYYHSEVATMVAYWIYLMDRQWSFLEQLLPGGPKPEYVKDRIDRMEKSYVLALSLPLSFQNDSIAFDVDDHVLISEAIVSSLGKRWKNLNGSTVSELLPTLKSIASGHRSKKVRETYTHLLRTHGFE